MPEKSSLFPLGTLMPSAREGPLNPPAFEHQGVGGVHPISAIVPTWTLVDTKQVSTPDRTTSPNHTKPRRRPTPEAYTPAHVRPYLSSFTTTLQPRCRRTVFVRPSRGIVRPADEVECTAAPFAAIAAVHRRAQFGAARSKRTLTANPGARKGPFGQLPLGRIFHEGARFPVLACFSGVGAGVSGFVPEILPPVWRCRSVSGDFRRFRVRSGVAGWVAGVGPTGLCWGSGFSRASAGRRPGGRGPARGRRRTGGSAPALYCG